MRGILVSAYWLLQGNRLASTYPLEKRCMPSSYHQAVAPLGALEWRSEPNDELRAVIVRTSLIDDIHCLKFQTRRLATTVLLRA
ncbi:hypothetical protein M404DRAFT_1003848 [Pisolithus tinctorius Marx 270]|uniref:Uncharacterized protein n=1 Tax=Pisolithus tinctorius Marx 270 TaxID=870435 RepID=A0A0C3NH99_PISTI|nr:hypothetical protein M404DRAFT_1003848 [Pisolithus tinctorius Marx 270]